MALNLSTAWRAPDELVNGINLLAVEIHQANLTSSDIGFDLELMAEIAPGPPFITAQPADQAVLEGATAVFQVTADGLTPLSYQWDFNGNAIAGATNTELIVIGATDQVGRACPRPLFKG